MSERQGYRNPVLPGFHPDPSICRAGDDFYLATSSFEYFPGVPIHHSRDLVTWRPIGHALTRESQLLLDGVRSSGGIFAPTLRHHEGTFYLVTTLVGRGNFVVTTTDPSGEWSDPIWLDEDGIDPSLAFLDGRIFYTRNGPGTDPDHPFIYQAELAERDGALELVSEPRVIWTGTGGIWPEAPHLYRRNGLFYLVTAEGGTEAGHSVVVARSNDPFGPFEVSPHGPLVTHRDEPDHPIQATGHADLVELENGTTWVVLLATRPANGYTHLGRETFLVELGWGEDGWPWIDGGRIPLSAMGPSLPRVQERRARPDTFAGGVLRPEWAFLRNPDPASWSLESETAGLRLIGNAYTLRDVAAPAFVSQSLPGLEAEARTVVEFEPRTVDEEAGLALYANEAFYTTLVVRGDAAGRRLELARTAAGERVVLRSDPLGEGPVTLALSCDATTATFSGGVDGALIEIGRVEHAFLSSEAIRRHSGRNHFTGAVVGPCATGNGRRSTAAATFRLFDLRMRD